MITTTTISISNSTMMTTGMTTAATLNASEGKSAKVNTTIEIYGLLYMIVLTYSDRSATITVILNLQRRGTQKMNVNTWEKYEFTRYMYMYVPVRYKYQYKYDISTSTCFKLIITDVNYVISTCTCTHV